MLVNKILHYIEKHDLLQTGEQVLVGISGGVDSIVLLHVLHELGYSLQAVHINYQLRGADAEADALFVQSLCDRVEVPLHMETCDAQERAETSGQSLQEAARELRYGVFLREATDHGIGSVAVAHHQDDQVETVLLNLFRGTGPEGLAGMPPSRALSRTSTARLIRPLLGVSRSTIQAYAEHVGLPWREDASNADTSYRRNAIRSDLVPLITSHFGTSAVGNIARAAALQRAYVDSDLRPLVEHQFTSMAASHPEGGTLDLVKMKALPKVWQGRMILEAQARWLPEAPRTEAFIDEVRALLDAQVGRRVVLQDGTIWREREHLRWVRSAPVHPAHAGRYDLEPGTTLVLPEGSLRAEYVAVRPDTLVNSSPYSVWMDASTLETPLQLRRWKAGDRLQPFGMDGTKKVSDVLTDAQIPAYRRKQVWVVCSGEEIIWVVGVRMGESVRVRPETQHIVTITYKPLQIPNETR